MKNKKILGIVGIILVILIIGAVVFGQNNFKKAEKKTEKTTEKKTEEPYLKAVYLKDEQGNSIFVQTDTEMVFFGTIPQELYDENEKKITEEDLHSGDVVKIWETELLHSLSCTVSGITKIQREEKENKDYIEKYGHYLEEFIVVPDENEPPYLDVSYKQPEALVTAAADTIAGVPALKLPELVELSVDGDTQAELLVSTQPENIEVVRWEAEASPVPKGEVVSAEKNEDGNWTITMQAGYIYQIKAIWADKEMEYGFSVTPVKTAE